MFHSRLWWFFYLCWHGSTYFKTYKDFSLSEYFGYDPPMMTSFCWCIWSSQKSVLSPTFYDEKSTKEVPKGSEKDLIGTFNCIYNSWINIYLSRCKFLFNDIFVLRKIQGLETVKIWLLRSRDNFKQDGKSLCSMLSSIFLKTQLLTVM